MKGPGAIDSGLGLEGFMKYANRREIIEGKPLLNVGEWAGFYFNSMVFAV